MTLIVCTLSPSLHDVWVKYFDFWQVTTVDENSSCFEEGADVCDVHPKAAISGGSEGSKPHQILLLLNLLFLMSPNTYPHVVWLLTGSSSEIYFTFLIVHICFRMFLMFSISYEVSLSICFISVQLKTSFFHPTYCNLVKFSQFKLQNNFISTRKLFLFCFRFRKNTFPFRKV